MIEISRLQDVLIPYKKAFVDTIWPDEKYKWEAVQHFQNTWDVNAEDFPAMLHQALDKTINLLASAGNFPRAMIEEFAKKDPEQVRSMFLALFDEQSDIIKRIEVFKTQAEHLLKTYGGSAKNHYQDENTITTYLWLRYPDKYYIYKYTEAKAVARTLGSNIVIKKGAYADNIRGSLELYDAICEALQSDEELVALFQAQLTDDCYPDPKLRTLAIDVGFYITTTFAKRPETIDDEWIPVGYTPGITTEQWIALLNDEEIFTPSSLEIMKRFKDAGGMATCTQLSHTYGETQNFYNSGSSSLGKRVADRTGCPLLKEPNYRYWPILFVGRDVQNAEVPGSFIWKLRSELSAALDAIDLGEVKLYADDDAPVDSERGYWWLNANPKIWSFSSFPIGSEVSYSLYNENGNKRRIFRNFLDAKAGDLVIGYESTPVKQVVGLARITAEQDGEHMYFEKTEGFVTPLSYSELASFEELKNMEFFANPQGSLFKLTEEEYSFILDLARESNPTVSDTKTFTPYTKADFLDQVYMTEQEYDSLVSLVRHKKNIILQGPPGVGKTYAARRLAHSMMGLKDDSRIEFIQFHQNYSYEDFMIGYKPVESSFELRFGVFHQFCEKARNYPDKEFFFIIDEINRGNLSKIFGELLMLIENNYRGEQITLAYNGMPFSVPKNLYLIGMMNTADRSLAMIDYALRRRFTFFEMSPGFDTAGYLAYQRKLGNETFDELMARIKQLNKAIEDDPSLGKGFCIGHSYFCEQESCTDAWMHTVLHYEIIPLLSEYWFDDEKKLDTWTNQLLGVLQ